MEMKKKKIAGMMLMAIVAMVFSSSLAFGQSPRKAGIKGGLNVSNLYIDDVNDENARYGFNVGFFGEVISGDAAALQLELLYSTKGSRAYYDGVFDQEVKYNLNYLDLPVLAVIKLGETAEIHLGGYASYLLQANIEYNGDWGSGNQEVNKDRLNSFDYGLTGGVGFNFGPVQIGARYNYGLAKIADDDVSRALIGDSKNSNAQVFVAFNLMHNH